MRGIIQGETACFVLASRRIFPRLLAAGGEVAEEEIPGEMSPATFTRTRGRAEEPKVFSTPSSSRRAGRMRPRYFGQAVFQVSVFSKSHHQQQFRR